MKRSVGADSEEFIASSLCRRDPRPFPQLLSPSCYREDYLDMIHAILFMNPYLTSDVSNLKSRRAFSPTMLSLPAITCYGVPPIDLSNYHQPEPKSGMNMWFDRGAAGSPELLSLCCRGPNPRISK